MIRSTQRHLAAVSGSRRHRPVDWASDNWRNSLLLIILTCLCIFLSNYKKINLSFFFIFASNYFQAIQTAVFYKKNTFKMFKCNFFHVSRHQIFDRLNRLGLEIRQRLRTISCFWYFLLYFFERFQRPLFSHFFKNLRPQYLYSFV